MDGDFKVSICLSFLIGIILFSATPCLFSQQYDEMLIDSVIGYQWDAETSEWLRNYQEIYRYNAFGNLLEQSEYRWDTVLNAWIGTYFDCYWHYYSCGGGKQEFTYDTRGNLTEQVAYGWDTISDDWRMVRHSQNTFDGAGNLIGEDICWYEWDRETGAFYYASREVCMFDASGHLTEEAYYERYELNQEWIGYHRSVYTRDAFGNEIERISFWWDDLYSEWINDWKEVMTYDSNGNQTEQISYYWDRYERVWMRDYRSVWTFDSTGNETGYTSYYWDGMWVIDWQTQYTCDPDGNRIEIIEQAWEYDHWRPWYRGVYTFDSSGNETTHISYMWDTGLDDWVYDSRYVNEYDSNGNQTGYTWYYWDEETSSWIWSDRRLYKYDSDGNRTEYASFYWHEGSQSWMGDYRYTYTYDSLGNEIEYVRYDWDEGIQTWMGDYRYVYAYDSSGNQTEYAQYEWDPASGEWIGDYRYLYNYNSSGNRIFDIKMHWDTTSGDWSDHEKRYYYWHEWGAHTVYIPDTVFLHALIEKGVDTSMDSLISFDEARAITKLIIGGVGSEEIKGVETTCAGVSGITDLTGIEAFANLDSLVIRCTQLEALNLFYNPSLVYLDCSENQISSLELGNNNSLMLLNCQGNQITELDITGNTELIGLNCSNNPISNLNITNNSKLNQLSLTEMPSLHEVCVWTMPFPPEDLEVDTTFSPALYFAQNCEALGGDRFEENDVQQWAAFIGQNELFEDLFVSRMDDDWYKIIPGSTDPFLPLTITCRFNHLEGDINMNLLDSEGVVMASSQGETDMERIVYPFYESEPYYLHLYLSEGSSNLYTLNWSKEYLIPNSNLSICSAPGNCDQFMLNLSTQDTIFSMDTLYVNLLAGDLLFRNISLRNQGPDTYYFYPFLDCSGINGYDNPGIQLDGQDGFIRVDQDTSLDITGEITLEAWIMNGGHASVIAKGISGEGYDLFLEEDGSVGFSVASVTIHSQAILEPDRWYHVAGTYDGYSIRLYINGLLDAELPATGHISVARRNLYFGINVMAFDLRRYFKGKIDEVRIWNRARKSREIHGHMNRALTGEEEGLVGYWPLNHTVDYVAKDLASGNHGYMTYGATWIDADNPVTDIVHWSTEYGIVEAGLDMDYIFEFNASNLPGGAYAADIRFISHNPLNPDFIIPVKLGVTDAPGLSIEPRSLQFGEINLYRTVTRELEVTNQGSEVLCIDSISTNLVGSRIVPPSAMIQPGERKKFELSVFRRKTESFSGQATFYSNDPTDREIMIPFSGWSNGIEHSYLIHTITDTVHLGYTKLHLWPFHNESTTHELLLEPCILTFSLPGDISDRMLQPDSVTGTWISTMLPDSSWVPPSGTTVCTVELDARGVGPGDYYADLVLEWYNPFYNRGFVPVHMYAKDPAVTGDPNQVSYDLQFYPNPVKDLLTVKTNISSTYTISIASMSGHVLLNSTFTGGSHQIDLTPFPGGIYFITIQSREFIATKKIIKLN